VRLGFAALYLNRTNRSGILSGGVIGGLKQTGDWGIDARFNREALSERLRKLGQYRGHIHVSCEDAEHFLKRLKIPKRALVYVDPPYYKKGQRLYRNHYEPEDHKRLARLVQSKLRNKWIVSYDNQREIARLYNGRRQLRYSLQYSAQTKRAGGELLIFSDGLALPKTRDPGSFRIN
jgi:DNA adenine methylase